VSHFPTNPNLKLDVCSFFLSVWSLSFRLYRYRWTLCVVEASTRKNISNGHLGMSPKVISCVVWKLRWSGSAMWQAAVGGGLLIKEARPLSEPLK
jgi:hypothetical protein